MKNNYIIVLLLGIVLISGFMSYKASQMEDQENRMEQGQKVYPVPLPSKLEFAGEKIPLDKLGIRERLDRELLVNSYWQSNGLLLLKRSKRAFKIIEPILEKYGVPDDFKYLAVAESGLQNVTSPAGAKGIWQFMDYTAIPYGLEINSEVDERFHLEKSTEIACLYLKEAYEIFGNWTLAAASYNRGKAGIQRDLKKQRVDNYYDLHLNQETARYVFRIIALKSLMESPKSYGFMLEQEDYYAETPVQLIYVDETIEDIAEWAESLGTNYHVIKTLNPWLKSNKLTVKEKTYTIKAPLT